MKYRITSETKVVGNITLHRIECVTAFGYVECGAKGGWVEKEANLSQYNNAWVFGNAKVSGGACVGDNAKVYGDAEVYGEAKVYGNACVGDNAKVYGDAEVYGEAWVFGNAKVSGGACVGDNAKVYGDAEVYGEAKVYGNACVYGEAKVSKDADYIVFKNWWSSGRYFTWTRSNNKWKVGCFYGSGEELIVKAYKDSEMSGREYERVVKYVNDILIGTVE